MPFSISDWNNPPKSFRVKPIIHGLADAPECLMEAVNDFGFGGVVTNPSRKNWYEGYRDNAKEFAEVIAKLEEYSVERCYYGHLHGPTHKRAIEGKLGGVEYHLVAADYLGFVPKKVLD